MTPYKVTFESPLELSAQGELARARLVLRLSAGARGWGLSPGLSSRTPGKQMIETYFDFRLYRLWKSRQHSKLLDFEDVL